MRGRLACCGLCLLGLIWLFFSIHAHALDEGPILFQPGIGWLPYTLTDTHDIVWLQEPNLEGLLASSEIIDEFGLESEIANDFILDNSVILTEVVWWGGYP
jgi:hypothetical protein